MKKDTVKIELDGTENFLERVKKVAEENNFGVFRVYEDGNLEKEIHRIDAEKGKFNDFKGSVTLLCLVPMIKHKNM